MAEAVSTGKSPFDDTRALLARLEGPDESAAAAVRQLYAESGKPRGSLGRLEDFAEWLAAWTGKVPPVVRRPLVAVFAGSHGVARRDVSPRSAAATRDTVARAAAGTAPINQFCAAADLGLKVFDLALDLPTGDIAVEPALDERGCAATIAFGMEAVAGDVDLLCVGDLGVGNSTVAAALFAALLGGRGADWIGSGSGADDTMMARKAEAVDAALSLNQGHLGDPLQVLRRVGGREFAAIAGAILAARIQHVPVIIDGFATTAAAAVLHAANPRALDHCVLAHLSAEPGHQRAADRLGLRPILDLKLHHGEAVGAALAAGIVKAAALSLSGMGRS